MICNSKKGLTFLLIILSLLLSTPLLAGNLDDFNWAKPGVNVEAGQVYIKITPDVAPLYIETIDDIVMTGISSLDAIADAFGVSNIEKTYQMRETPKDDNIPDLSRYYTVTFPEEFGPFVLINSYEACPEVVFSEFVTINRYCYIPNDSRFRNQWHLEHCGLPGAWDVTHGSEDIVIGIVDGGLDMDAFDDNFLVIHEDFVDNLWHNPGEDLNHDGICTWEDDLDDEDNDNNGYVDDFHGWDFSGRDNWPDDYWGADGGHGTHVAGCASAVTDNEIGVSGAGFHCKLMTCAHYSTEEPGKNIGGYRGIEYCADNGADVINLSWGGYYRSQRTEADAVLYAQRMGSIIFAGAGNDDANDQSNNQSHFYPCAYDDIIGVGANDGNDRKADFSNYGDYTDIITPGVGILSGFPRNSYASLQGTSMSSPFAAGIGALALSVRPDLNSRELLEWMQRTAVDISEVGDNENYPGITYRVNADFLINSTHPKYELVSWEIIEADGDQNGRIDHSETISINMTFGNTEGYTDAKNVTISLENDDPHIEIISEATVIGDIDAGDELELWDTDYPTFRVNDDSPIHYSTFTVVLNSDEEFTQTFDITLTIRHPKYLVVDDDEGARYHEYYEEDLALQPIVHDLWQVEETGLPSADELAGYEFLIWETGNAENPLSDDEMQLISGYLDNGGGLLLTGQYIGDAIGNTDFHRNYLKANHLEDNIRNYELNGVAENPITNGLELLLVGGGGAGNGRQSPSSMEPIGGAVPIFNYNNEAKDVAGIVYDGDYKLVYFGFALEAVSGNGGTNTRLDVIEHILRYLSDLDVSSALSTAIPLEFKVSYPHPNPFNAITSVQVDVPSEAPFNIDVIDVSGRRIAVLHQGQTAPGTHTYSWNADNYPAGIYFFNLSWEQGSTVRKVALVK